MACQNAWGISLCWLLCGLAVSLARPKSGEVVASRLDANQSGTTEPSCEELRAMWRFSKRQSRAAEVTNEIPTYRDPFINNVWELPYVAYARSKSVAGLHSGSGARLRNSMKPFSYGRVLHHPPGRLHAFQEVAQMYGTVHQGLSPTRRRVTSFRNSPGNSVLSPHSGSFQHLKELIRTERARELQEQRLAEEIAARAAVLKEMASHGDSRRQSHTHNPRYHYDIEEMRDSPSSGPSSGNQPDSIETIGVLTFPDLLAPAIQQPQLGVDYAYQTSRAPTIRSNRASYVDSNAYERDEDDVDRRFMLRR